MMHPPLFHYKSFMWKEKIDCKEDLNHRLSRETFKIFKKPKNQCTMEQFRSLRIVTYIFLYSIWFYVNNINCDQHKTF